MPNGAVPLQPGQHLSEVPPRQIPKWWVLLRRENFAAWILLVYKILPRTFYPAFTGILLDVCIGVDQKISAGMARCALYRFHIAAGNHQLIGGTGMPQTVKHDLLKLRVLRTPCAAPFIAIPRISANNHKI